LKGSYQRNGKKHESYCEIELRERTKITKVAMCKVKNTINLRYMVTEMKEGPRPQSPNNPK